ncbi:rho GTPase-activating protein 27-like [Paramormyrops kingsleyae]|uniref:rho GTPase-activating protein 27-like n=1 Tax=Paramormyrops kingsleyae TaxID=1676925 RepID=UPI000CD61A26|nr:rho GTPase-activating protein 12-like [Paramormyrops kingsleyae]
MTNKGLVLVEYKYEYLGRDGDLVSIKPNERYVLLAKTNDHWWHVRKDEHAKPFYIPAKYVKELPSHLPSPLDFIESMNPEPTQNRGEKRATDSPEEKHLEVAIRLQSPAQSKKTENRMSTFGIPLDMHNQEFRRGGLPDSFLAQHSQEHATKSASGKNTSQKIQTPSVFDCQLPTEDSPPFSLLPREPSFRPADPLKRQTKAKPVEPVVIKSIKVTPEVHESVRTPSAPEDLKEPSSLHPKQPLEADNIYESILDVGLQNRETPVFGVAPVPSPGAPAQTPPTSAHTPSQTENDSTSVYPSVNEPKNNLPQASVNSSNNNHETAQVTAAGACSSPKEQLPVQEAPSTPSATTGTTADSKVETDGTGGRHYSYNPPTGSTVWPAKSAEPQGLPRVQDDVPPPLPEEDYPDDSQDGWGPLVFPEDFHPTIPRAAVDFNTLSGWRHTSDPYGKPALTGEVKQEQLPVPSGQPKMGFTVDGGLSVMKNWRHSLSNFSGNLDDISFSSAPKRRTSDCSGEETHHHSHILEKAGIVNKTKISDNGKRLRKSWSPSWTVLHGGILTFHKDPKSTPAGAINKSTQIIPEYTVELRGATINWATKDKSSKKNVLELKTRHGSEYLMQYDTISIITDWYYTIKDTIHQLDRDDQSDEEEDEHDEKVPGHGDKDDKKKNYGRHSTPVSSTESEQGRVRNKLRRFLQRRPTLQSVKERGYIQENVFGCPLENLCTRERSTVPSFVDKCIKSVEKRGLDIDGIYRVSGNLAVIQKLRYKVDHEENLDLDDGQWEEIHVITGALKLFFRELPEPLFPFSHFNKFIAAINNTDYSLKMNTICELVRSLPQPNYDTMKVLFGHLHKVIQFGEKNRMSAQSVAIVFGPTLLRPEVESANITMYMIFQTQIVEFMLKETDKIFQA